jgi:hypothetical protein
VLTSFQIPSLASPATTLPSPASGVAPLSAPTVPSKSTPKDGGGLTSGAIAGIVIGAVVGFAVIVALAYVVWIIRKRNRPATSETPYEVPESEKPSTIPNYPPQKQMHGPVEMDSGPPAELDAELQRHEMEAYERENEMKNPQPLPHI